MDIVTLMHSSFDFGWIKFMSSVGLSDNKSTYFRSIIKCVIIGRLYWHKLCDKSKARYWHKLHLCQKTRRYYRHKFVSQAEICANSPPYISHTNCAPTAGATIHTSLCYKLEFVPIAHIIRGHKLCAEPQQLLLAQICATSWDLCQ